MAFVHKDVMLSGEFDVHLSLFFGFGNATVIVNGLIGELNHPMPFVIRIALPNPLVGLFVCQELLNL